MKLTCREIQTVRILSVHGRIDHANTEAFQQALAPYLADCSDSGMSIVLDLADVEYISSIGLRALMLASRKAKSQSGKIVLAALTPIVSEVFKISRFDTLFEIFQTTEAAIAALSK